MKFPFYGIKINPGEYRLPTHLQTTVDIPGLINAVQKHIKEQPMLNDRKPIRVKITETDIVVTLSDNSAISNPINWHTWLQNATEAQKQKFTLHAKSIYWQDLNEGLDIEGMLRGIQSK